ncbi:hypothetical protein ACN28I_22840 [Archangium gephyra]|uniref:hypothetical protein n=1 Tax=Archangium gephyra TaxID=48 RepID=UPI003B7AB62F
MPALIKQSEITCPEPVIIDFGFSGLSEKHAQSIMRDIIRDNWPELRRPDQCVYVIRLVGQVAASYPLDFSPVIYVGEGNAYERLYNHTNWIVPLVQSVPRLGIEIRIAQVARRNNVNLYQYIEADLLRWFADIYGSLPWFNRQFEPSKEGTHTYEPGAERDLMRLIGVGGGNRFLWAIQPTHNNELYLPYTKGATAAA